MRRRAAPRLRRAVALAAGLAAFAGCGHAPYAAPAPGETPSLDGLPAGPEDPGDLLRVTQAEAACRSSLTGRTIVASVQAVEDVTSALAAACDVLLEDEDPLAWRVWCRSDALFESGHYLRADGGRFRCGGRDTANAFDCIGRILGERVIAPGYTDRVELVTVGHVDLQPVALGGAFAADGCVELQRRFGIRNPWQAIDPELLDERFPTDEAKEQARQEWNDRLAWCRAAHAAREISSGMESASPGARGDVDLAVVGMGPDWLSTKGVCPSTGAASTRCEDARRVDVLVRFVPATRDVVSRCEAGAGERAEDEVRRALWCWEDCIGSQNLGQTAQGDVAAGQTPPLFGTGGGDLGTRWVIHRAPGPTRDPLHADTVRRILGLGGS